MSPGKLAWAGGRAPDGARPPPVTKTDEEFAALGVEFCETLEGIKVTELNELFEKVRLCACVRAFACVA